MHFISNTEWQIDDQMYTRGTFEKTERECWKLAKVFLILSPRQLFIILYSSHSHIHPHTHMHTLADKHLLMHTWKTHLQ